MDKLWAPWREKYIAQSNKAKECLFCKVSKEKSDRKNLIVMRSKYAFCLLNKFPYNNGHLMLSPYRHLKDFSGLHNDETLDLFSTLNKMQSLLKEVLSPDGFNIGMNIGKVSGAGIPNHMHIHIVPRWKEDTNFMPVLFETKIISQSLEVLYDKLYERI